MDLNEWLEREGLSKYANLFAANDIDDVDILAELNDAELEAIGIPIGSRKKIQRALAGQSFLSEEAQAVAPQTSLSETAARPPVQQSVAPVEQVDLQHDHPPRQVIVEPHQLAPPASSPQQTRHQPKAKNSRKATAIMIAVGVHVGIILLATTLTIFAASKDEPEIIATIAPPSSSPQQEMKKKTVQKQTKHTPSAAAAAAAPMAMLMKANAQARFSTPDVTRTSTGPLGMSEGDLGSGAFGVGSGLEGAGSFGGGMSVPSGMKSRCSPAERKKRLREGGADSRTERAIVKGLEYLTSQQNKETGAIGNDYKAGVSGLTLLAYLGHCETPESPKFGDAVVKVALYLMERAIKNEGQLTTEGTDRSGQIYEHAIATYALAELFTMTKGSGKKIPRLEPVLKKCIQVIVDTQDPKGGWSYGFGNGGIEDMSVSSWMIQALKAAHNTGRNFSGVDRALDKAVKQFLPAVQGENGSFKYRLADPDGKASLTAAALLGMQIWGQTGSPAYNRGLARLNQAYADPAPSEQNYGFYDEYYNTQVYFMHGGEEWKNYNRQFPPKLIDLQGADGSWGIGGFKNDDCTIMNTALAILMLEVYYRYLPTTDKVSGR